MASSYANAPAMADDVIVKSAGSRDSKQIFTEDWQTEGVMNDLLESVSF